MSTADADRRVRLEVTLAFAQSDEAHQIWGDELQAEIVEILERRLAEVTR